MSLGAAYFNSRDHFVISNIEGLYSFPAPKTTGTDWMDENGTEHTNRLIDYQYGVRRIIVDCVISAANWTLLNQKIENVKGSITGNMSINGALLMSLPGYSTRGYVVKLSRGIEVSPVKVFRSSRSVAIMRIHFEEAQPFNIQFSLVYSTAGIKNISCRIQKTSKGLSFGSTAQQFVSVYFGNQVYEVNLEQEALQIYTTLNPEVGQYYPLVITGEIDAIEDIFININATIVGLEVADLFLRNGEITLEE